MALGAASQKNELVQKNLTHVKLTAHEDGRLTILTNSIEIAFRATIEAQVERPGVLMVDAKRITDHVSSQAGDTITFEQKKTSGNVSVRSGKNRSSIPHFPDSDLSDIEAFNNTVGKVSLDMLAQMLSRVSFAISTDDSAYTITAAKLELGDAGITAVATDAKKLSLSENASDDLSKAEAMITKKAISELTKIHSKSAGTDVEIGIDKKGSLYFYMGHRTFFALGVTGKFPRWNVAFMKGDHKRVMVRNSELKAVIERVGNFADNQSSALDFTIANNTLTVAASHHSLGDAEEDIEIEYEGEEITVTLSSKNIMDFLRLAGDRNIELAFLNPMAPVEFRVEGDPTWVVVVMPMKK